MLADTLRSGPGRRPFVVVLTGGIASGKTAVSDRFAARGVPVVDTDLIAREIVQPGQPALAAIVDAFGEAVLNEAGELDRGRMRERIFSDPASKQKLEGILHPAIAARAQQRVASLDSPYCLLVIPLLAESGRRPKPGYYGADRVLVVDVDEDTQLERLVARDGSSLQQARAIVSAQASRQERLALADDVIVNDGSLAQLDQAVANLHENYLRLARGLSRRN